jgi:hypothetical protein
MLSPRSGFWAFTHFQVTTWHRPSPFQESKAPDKQSLLRRSSAKFCPLAKQVKQPGLQPVFVSDLDCKSTTPARQLLEKGLQPRYELHGAGKHRVIEKGELENHRPQFSAQTCAVLTNSSNSFSQSTRIF